ncbi:ORF6N domain-containing protein [Providencia stuartii]|uniref:ORF6N domain-containing protein n=1 Tax=Providencia stuartii TaxID=588 RepID=UPI001BB683DD|nr:MULTISPECIES: ORF6N domain-containing protein [Providencia]MDF4173529.1 ORF6N domain-containing protein [Providencia thailandensis]QUC24690.1 ORF6N domain-containing protein [Providencia stuartii]CAK6608588.1 ORF6N domain-containing protein [Providencia stuartii]CAK6610674.1 ORF6N domain-containing protein [Providencia stuartii]
MSELITIDANSLPVIEWRGVRVVTTETLAAGYGASAKNIQDNLLNNKSRFIDGVHYFKLEGDELRQFKKVPDNIGLVSKHTSQQILWTEKGAARMSKIVDSDEAWSFFEKMEDAYFRPAPTEVSRKQLALMVIEAENRAEAFQLENKHLSATVESLEKHLTKGMTLTSFCKSLNGVNVHKIMQWASERNWVYNSRRDPEKKPKWRVTSYARDKYLTEEETKIKTRSLDEIIKFTPVLLEKGCHRLYQLYMKGELPMKKTWNGEFSHNKAIYTPEIK